MPIKSDEKESSFSALQRLPWNSVDALKKLSNNQFLTHIDFKLLKCHPIKLEQN